MTASPILSPVCASTQSCDMEDVGNLMRRAVKRVKQQREHPPCYWPFDVVSGGQPPEIPMEEREFWSDRAKYQGIKSNGFKVALEYSPWTQTWNRVPRITVRREFHKVNYDGEASREKGMRDACRRKMRQCSMCFHLEPKTKEALFARDSEGGEETLCG